MHYKAHDRRFMRRFNGWGAKVRSFSGRTRGSGLAAGIEQAAGRTHGHRGQRTPGQESILQARNLGEIDQIAVT